MPSMPYSTGYLKATSNSRAHSQGFCMETSGASGTFRGCKAIHVSVGECCLVLVDVTGYLIPIQHISYFFYFLVVKKGFIFFFIIVDDHCCEFLQLATLARDRTRLVRDRTRLV
ncbi:uncharacterized protein [Rutidosis leptorrhynchoides]|uniref:uncharacterized protein isoform X2 n=1 Tax=Rutidosis leptorrhynchoides TaxID=125765 RepID=UPI003A98FB5A